MLFGRGFVFSGSGVDLTVKNYVGSKAMFSLAGLATTAGQSTLLITGLKNVSFENVQVVLASADAKRWAMSGSIISKDPAQADQLKLRLAVIRVMFHLYLTPLICPSLGRHIVRMHLVG